MQCNSTNSPPPINWPSHVYGHGPSRYVLMRSFMILSCQLFSPFQFLFLLGPLSAIVSCLMVHSPSCRACFTVDNTKSDQYFDSYQVRPADDKKILLLLTTKNAWTFEISTTRVFDIGKTLLKTRKTRVRAQFKKDWNCLCFAIWCLFF